MQTVSTPIKDLKKGDKVLHYSSVFEITSDVRFFPAGTGNDVVNVPVCDCKRVETSEYISGIDSLLAGYDAFQGFWNVAKIVIN